MNKLSLVQFLFFFPIGMLCICGCKKEELPSVSTSVIKSVSQTTALCESSVESEGSSAVIRRGICWSSLNETPSASDTLTKDGAGVGNYLSRLTRLFPGTAYYVRPYATNSSGTSYGMVVSFTTLQAALSEVITAEITEVTDTSATCGGEIKLVEGAVPVIDRGTCWNTSSNPTINDFKTSDGTGTGTFTSRLSSLSPGTDYYVRSYAMNSAGVSYGQELSFTTTRTTLPSVSFGQIINVGATSARFSGRVDSDGGSFVTRRGVCWSTSPHPLISDFRTIDGTGTGIYTSNLIGLTPNTKYYYRAYAVNRVGIKYGTEWEFTTHLTGIPGNFQVNIGYISKTRIMCSIEYPGYSGDADISEWGVCYNTSNNPTVHDYKKTADEVKELLIINVTGLVPDTKYYIRGFASNDIGTAYTNECSFSTLDTPVEIVSDGEGNEYETVTIGNQVWLKSNLVTAKYNNNENIGTLTLYNYTPVYGYLYKYSSVTDIRGVCPTGWHVPSDAEWNTLFQFLSINGYGYEGSGNDIAKSLSAQEGWADWRYTFMPCYPDRGPVDPGTPGNDPQSNNRSGFTALPGGYEPYDCPPAGRIGGWWSSNGYGPVIRNDRPDVQWEAYGTKLSIRCIKD